MVSQSDWLPMRMAILGARAFGMRYQEAARQRFAQAQAMIGGMSLSMSFWIWSFS